MPGKTVNLRYAFTNIARLTLLLSVLGAFTAYAGTLNKSDRSVLAEHRAIGMEHAVVVIAARSRMTADIVASLATMGAVIRYREDAVDYVSAVVPVEQIERIAALPSIEQLNIDTPAIRALDDLPPTPAGRAEKSTHEALPDLDSASRRGDGRVTFAGPRADSLPENGFLPTKDVGAPQFITAHPTFDGRGVTIAIVDTGVEVLVPELQVATTLDGRPTRKIVDWVTATGPVDDKLPAPALIGARANSRWIDMQKEVISSGFHIVNEGVRYLIPREGKFRLGFFNEREGILSSPNFLGGDVNRDGNAPGSSGLFPVLWSEASNEVWVDTNQDNSFADERALQDYARRFDIGVFGKDNPKTAVRETVPFVIQTDLKQKFVYLGISVRDHGTMVAGTAAGRGFFGAFDGVAPGAQIVSVIDEEDQVLYFYHTGIEALILATKHPRVDIVNHSFGVEGVLNDGRHVMEIILDRLVEVYGKPIFTSVGNFGPGMNTALAASRTFSIGAYIGRDTWLDNFGIDVSKRDYLFGSSARGPREDGALKPDFVAPSGALTARPAILEGRTRVDVYPLPPGYMIGGGTSQAAPFAAGVAALLISAAKQASIPYDVDRLRVALMNGARFMPDYQAYEQGNGLIEVGRSWIALQKMKRAPPVTIVSRSSVQTSLSGLLQAPNVGSGLYEREGWTVGQRGKRTIVLTRVSGPDKDIPYDLRWIGNDGTYASQTSVVLALNVPTEVPIDVVVSRLGVHSAMLEVIDRSLSLTVHRLSTLIVAAEHLEAHRGFRTTHSKEVPRPGSISNFFFIPPGVSALDVTTKIRRGRLLSRVFKPNGQSDQLTFEAAEKPTGYEGPGSWSRTFLRPDPGVWEVSTVNFQDLSKLNPEHHGSLPSGLYETTVRILGAQLTNAEGLSEGDSVVRSIDMSNGLGAFHGGLVGSSLAAVFHARPTLIAAQTQWLHPIVVREGTEKLLLELDDPSDPAADLDLYLFDCTGRRCVLRAWSNGLGPREAVEINTPAQGLWKVVVDAFALPLNSAQFDYSETLWHPKYGRIDVAHGFEYRATGARWRENVSISVNAKPDDSDHELRGVIDLVADDSGSKDIARIQRALTIGRIAVPIAAPDAVQ